MGKLIILLLFGLSCSEVVASDSYTFKGFEKVNEAAFERIYKPTTEFPHLGRLLNVYSFGTDSILNLLGYFPVGHNDSEMVNGHPNTMNTLLYFMLFDRMAQGMANHCALLEDPVVVLNYRQEFLNHLWLWCTSPMDRVPDDYNLEALWLQIIGYQAPQSEYQIWRDYIMARDFKTAEERVYHIFLTLLLNPYFFINN